VNDEQILRNAREIAASAWCAETTKKTVMDPVLAEEFAKILAREYKRCREEVEFAKEGWHNWEQHAKNGWAAQEAASKREDKALQDLETERMCLAGCCTAALGNTREQVAKRIAPGHPYYSPAYGDICRAVDREIKYREALEKIASNDPENDSVAIAARALK
jgi:hypothetical protein